MLDLQVVRAGGWRAGGGLGVQRGHLACRQLAVEHPHLVDQTDEPVVGVGAPAADLQAAAGHRVGRARRACEPGERLGHAVDVELVVDDAAIGEHGHHMPPGLRQAGRWHAMDIALRRVEAEVRAAEPQVMQMPADRHAIAAARPVHPERHRGLGACCGGHRQAGDDEARPVVDRARQAGVAAGAWGAGDGRRAAGGGGPGGALRLAVERATAVAGAVDQLACGAVVAGFVEVVAGNQRGLFLGEQPATVGGARRDDRVDRIAGPQPVQRCHRLPAVFVELHRDGVVHPGIERDGAAVVQRRAVVGPVVHQLHAVHPQAHAVVAAGLEAIAAGHRHAHEACPADAEPVGRHACGWGSIDPVESHRAIHALEAGGIGQGHVVEVDAGQAGSVRHRAQRRHGRGGVVAHAAVAATALVAAAHTGHRGLQAQGDGPAAGQCLHAGLGHRRLRQRDRARMRPDVADHGGAVADADVGAATCHDGASHGGLLADGDGAAGRDAATHLAAVGRGHLRAGADVAAHHGLVGQDRIASVDGDVAGHAGLVAQADLAGRGAQAAAEADGAICVMDLVGLHGGVHHRLVAGPEPAAHHQGQVAGAA